MSLARLPKMSTFSWKTRKEIWKNVWKVLWDRWKSCNHLYPYSIGQHLPSFKEAGKCNLVSYLRKRKIDSLNNFFKRKFLMQYALLVTKYPTKSRAHFLFPQVRQSKILPSDCNQLQVQGSEWCTVFSISSEYGSLRFSDTCTKHTSYRNFSTTTLPNLLCWRRTGDTQRQWSIWQAF